MVRPVSIENRWDILYRDYPEVYDAFMNVPYIPSVFDLVPEIIDFQGKIIADMGAGTGKSSMALAQYARQVIGIEFEPAMLREAQRISSRVEAAHVTYLAGDALAIPLADSSVDIVAGFTLALFPAERYREFIQEGLRVAKEKVVYVGIPPGWYGGDLDHVIENPYKGKFEEDMERIFLDEFQFSYQDVYSIQEYGTIEKIVEIYGFIFGTKVTEYLKHENKTAIKWKYRVYWKKST